MANQSLLPSHASDLQLALEQLEADRMALIDQYVTTVYDPKDAPESLLDHLAQHYGADIWRGRWTTHRKRFVLDAMPYIRAHRGSLSALRRVLDLFDHADADVNEGIADEIADGTYIADGTLLAGSAEGWAQYNITLKRPMALKEYPFLRAMLLYAAPVAAKLHRIIFTAATHMADGSYIADGTYTAGEISPTPGG